MNAIDLSTIDGPSCDTPAGPAVLVDDSTKGQALVRFPSGRLAVYPAEAVRVTSGLFA